MSVTQVIDYWFEQLSPADWWRKNEQLDAQIAERFGALHQKLAGSDSPQWQQDDDARLAEIIVLDQFSRNMFRGQQGAFAYDPQALSCTRAAVANKVLDRLAPPRTNFVLMPYMHSESLADHDEGLALFEQYSAQDTVEFERRHRAIIERFGRYPHRNEILGRESTAEEIEFLTRPGSSF